MPPAHVRPAAPAPPAARASAAADAAAPTGEERALAEVRALAGIVQRINQSLELDRVCALVVADASDLLAARAARLCIIEGTELLTVSAAGDDAPAIGARAPVDEGIAGQCVFRLEPVRGEHEDGAALAAPLTVGGRPIGAIVVVAGPDRVFGDHDEELLLALANHAAVAIENARLFHASVRTMRHASILATAARSLALNVTPEAMYADIARLARASLAADGITIYLAEPDDGPASVAHADPDTAAIARGVAERFWDSPAGAAARAARAEFIPDLVARRGTDPVTDTMIDRGVRSAALIPLVVEGRPRGLLALRFRTPQAFPIEHRQLLVDFGAHAAVALRNALLMADMARRAGRLAAVAKVQQAISAATSLADVYAEIYKAVASVVDAPCFTLYAFDAEARLFTPEYVVNDGAPIDAGTLPRFPIGDGATSQALRTREPNITARTARGWTGRAFEVRGAGEIAVALSAPIIFGEQVLGVLQAQSYRQNAYAWDDVDLIMLVARQAGTAISRARSFEAERQARREAEAAAAIARVPLRATSVEEAAAELLRVLEQVAPCTAAALAITDDDGSALRYVAVHGEAAALAGGTAPRGGSDAPRAAAAGARGAAAHHLERLQGVWGTVIPLLSRDRVIGAVALDAAPAGTAAMRSYATATRLAAPVALALDAMLLRNEERRQQVSERMLAAALEAMDQPVLVCTPAGIIQHANGAAGREYGYPVEELVGTSLDRLTIIPAGQAEGDALLATILARGVSAGERLQRRRDGREFPAYIIGSAIRDADGQPVGIVVVARNLNEERRVAEQLRQSERLAALGELVAGVAHEVNNPLAGISAFAQLLQQDPLDAEQREAVGMIKREADRAVAVVRDLLTFARKTGPRSVPTDFNELVELTLRLRTYGLRTAGVTVALELDRELPLVLGDDRQLQQVLLNLIVNAEHAMMAARERVLRIRTRAEHGRVIVEVADTGVGMSPDVQKRVFEPFFTTKPEGRGTGLGLSVSYGIVQTHGGTLTVHSAPGAGATFRLSLPALALPERTNA